MHTIAGATGHPGSGAAPSLLRRGVPDSTEPSRWSHHLKHRLGEPGAVLTSIRLGHMQEKVEDVPGSLVGAYVYPVCGEDADMRMRTMAQPEIRKALAAALPAVSVVVAPDGHDTTGREADGPGLVQPRSAGTIDDAAPEVAARAICGVHP